MTCTDLDLRSAQLARETRVVLDERQHVVDHGSQVEALRLDQHQLFLHADRERDRGLERRHDLRQRQRLVFSHAGGRTAQRDSAIPGALAVTFSIAIDPFSPLPCQSGVAPSYSYRRICPRDAAANAADQRSAARFLTIA